MQPRLLFPPRGERHFPGIFGPSSDSTSAPTSHSCQHWFCNRKLPPVGVSSGPGDSCILVPYSLLRRFPTRHSHVVLSFRKEWPMVRWRGAVHQMTQSSLSPRFSLACSGGFLFLGCRMLLSALELKEAVLCKMITSTCQLAQRSHAVHIYL